MKTRSRIARPTRREILALAGAGAVFSLLPAESVSANGPRVLTAAPGSAPIGAPEYPMTKVWAYNGSVPGPVLRVRQGGTIRLRFDNRLPQPSTIHWHGIRIANAMDGVAGLTQAAVPPGESFDYTFRVPDAGTFWYHPHNRSWEQVARGLYGALIVEEKDAPPVDRDLVMIVDDWRLDKKGEIHEASMGSMMDAAHAGRLGNWVTVNGKAKSDLKVTRGQRLRLRLVNAATARIMSVVFEEHEPTIIALDGQPVTPRRTNKGAVRLAPGQRADVVLDMEMDPGARAPIRVVSGRTIADVGEIVYGPGVVKREKPLDAIGRLPANPLPAKLDLGGAIKIDVIMEGGAMGGMRTAILDGESLGMRELFHKGMAWSLNGVAGRTKKPLLDAPRGRTVAMRLVNRTSWPHAMHLHGHHFRTIERNRLPVANAAWRDTVLVERGDEARIAFVADNPGKWMFHCHMLEHQAAGMTTWIRVGA